MPIRTYKNGFKNRDEVAGKVIRSQSLAKKLLHCTPPNVIIDIKPDRENYEKTVFVFRNDDKFQSDLKDILDEREKEREKEREEERFKDVKAMLGMIVEDKINEIMNNQGE